VLWNGSALYHEAGRTPSRYVGASTGFTLPVVAGIRVRVGSFRCQMVPGEEMQLDKEQGFVKLTNQRLIFSDSSARTEWAFTILLSAVRTEDGNGFLLGVSNRKKTSGLRFSRVDGHTLQGYLEWPFTALKKALPQQKEPSKMRLKPLRVINLL